MVQQGDPQRGDYVYTRDRITIAIVLALVVGAIIALAVCKEDRHQHDKRYAPTGQRHEQAPESRHAAAGISRALTACAISAEGARIFEGPRDQEQPGAS